MSHEMNEDQKEVLREYASLKVKAREISNKMEEIKGTVYNILTEAEADLEPVQLKEGGQFTLRPRRIWTFSPKLEAKIKEVDAEQKAERSLGLATFETVHDVYFK